MMNGHHRHRHRRSCSSNNNLIDILICVFAAGFLLNSPTLHWKHQQILVASFSSPRRRLPKRVYYSRHGRSSIGISNTNKEENENDNVQSVDVSDLGLTMEDLHKPIPQELLSTTGFTILGSGLESTSRIEAVNDEGCVWEESHELIGATLSIAGLRGQAVGAMDVVFSTTTCSVRVCGYTVWSCLLKGRCVPETALSNIQDGYDTVPLITVSVAKEVNNDNNNNKFRCWDGFIEAIGEDSIL